MKAVVTARYDEASDTYVVLIDDLLRRYPGVDIRKACAGNLPSFDPLDPKYVVQ